MTITHDTQIALSASDRSLAKAAVAAFMRALRAIREWQLNAEQRRQVGQLNAHLQLDVGEIDQLPARLAKEASYQDRLEREWMR